MALGDIWQLTLRSKVLGEDTFNVFYYEETTAETANLPEVALAEAFEEDFNVPLRAVLTGGTTLVDITVKQLTGGAAIYTNVYGAVGDIGDETMPRFVAWSFRYNRATAAGRHGYKRFAGVPESWVSNGVAASGAGVPLATLAAALFVPLQWNGSGGDGFFTPRILSRFVNGQPRVTPVAQPVSSVIYNGVTSQTSRK